MDRTDTISQTSFTLSDPDTVTFDFIAQHQIRVTVPASSAWRTETHWHSPDQENCLLLHAEHGAFHAGYYGEPRTGADVIGSGNFKFRPDRWNYWSRWSSPRKAPGEFIVLFVVRDASLYRNTCSAILDAEKFPYLSSTPFWLRGIFAALKVIPPVRQWLVRWMLYVQLQTIYHQYGYWQYHGGINALSWWQAIFTWKIGEHPRWTVTLQYRSQKFFSKVVQRGYSWMGRMLFGMKADYPQYNPHFGHSSPASKDLLTASSMAAEEILEQTAASKKM